MAPITPVQLVHCTVPGGGSPAAVGADILVVETLLVRTLVLLDQGLA